MVNRMKNVISMMLVVALTSIGMTSAQAQRRTYGARDQQAQAVVGRIENRTTVYRDSLAVALNQNNINTSSSEDNINLFVRNFSSEITQLRNRLSRGRATTSDVQQVLDQATLIDNFMLRNRLGARAERDWSAMTVDISELARIYGLSWTRGTRVNNQNNNQTVSGANRLTGTFQLDAQRSDDARDAAERALRSVNIRDRQRAIDALTARLQSPDRLAIERRGTMVTLASSRSPQFTFDANGRENVEQTDGGFTVRTRAALRGDQLNVSYTGDRGNDFSVTFDPIENGRRLIVVRRVTDPAVGRPVVVQSFYNRISDVAQWSVYNGTEINTVQTSTTQTNTTQTTVNNDYLFTDGATVVATLNDNLSTQQTREGDRFRMTVREPAQYQGAIIEGYVSNVKRAGRITGRSEMTLNFETIRLPNNSTYKFSGMVEGVRTASGETVNTDTEGSVRDDSQTNRTATRTAIGAGIGAIIGAAIGGGRGAAIGAAIGAGSGAGSVYVQGREDLELMSGTEVTIRASAPTR